MPGKPPADVRKLFNDALRHADVARRFASPDAELSHVGFRAADAQEWKRLQETAAPYGETFLTPKGNRTVVFVRLREALAGGGLSLNYLEFPEPKTPPEPGQSPVVVAFTHPTVAIGPKLCKEFELRQTPHHARDFIGKGR